MRASRASSAAIVAAGFLAIGVGVEFPGRAEPAAASPGAAAGTAENAALQQPAPATAVPVAAPGESAVAKLEALVRQAAAAESVSRKVELYEAALAYLDQLAIVDADAVSKFDTETLLSAAADSFLVYAEDDKRPQEERQRVLAEARDVLPRILDLGRQARSYLRLVRSELVLVGVANAVLSIHKVDSLTIGLADAAERDRVRLELLRLTLPLAEVDLAVKISWCLSISDAHLAAEAMRATALSEIAEGRTSRKLLAAARSARNDGGRALEAYLSAELTQRSFQQALITALAFADDAARDRALGRVLDRQLEIRTRPEAMIAPYGIQDTATRDAAYARLAAYAIDRGRLAIAQKLSPRILTPEPRLATLVAVAQRLATENYRGEWAIAWDAAFGTAQAAALPATSDILKLGVQAAEQSDAARSTAAIERLGAGDHADEIRLRLAVTRAEAGDVGTAMAQSLAIASPRHRSEIAGAAYANLIARRQLVQASLVWPMLTEPADRAEALVKQSTALYGNLGDRAYDADRAHRDLALALQLSAGVTEPTRRADLLRLICEAYAQLGDVVAVEGAIARAEPESRDALKAYRLGAIARSGRTADAMAGLPPAGSSWRDSALTEIGAALSESGQFIEAYDVAVQITSERDRRRNLRRLAETQAARQATGLTDIDDDQSTLLASSASTISNGRFIVKAERISGPRKMPDFKSLAQVSGRDIRQMVPPVQPGKASLVPIGFSNFNEKFSYIRYLNSVDLNGSEEDTLAESQGTLFPGFILIENGVFDLPSLQAILMAQGSNGLTNVGRTYQLNIPLLVGRNATLVITSSDVSELRLNTKGHAYIINSGKFFLVDAGLTSWDPETNKATPRTKKEWDEFNPFYTAWSGSETYIADAHIHALGYGNGKSYGLSFSSGPTNVLKATLHAIAAPTGIVVDSTFTQMYYAFYSYEADDIRLVGNEYRENEIYGIDPHDRTKRLTIAYNTTAKTHAKHGIIGSRGVSDSAIFGNISADNHGSGFMLDRDSGHNIVAYNLGFRNGGDGATMYESSCNIISRNTFTRNKRDGLKLRNSWDLLVADNLIENNNGFGINLYSMRLEGTLTAVSRDFEEDPYVRYASATATGNAIKQNAKSPLRSMSTGVFILGENRISGSMQKLFKQTDLSLLGPGLLSMASGGAVVRDSCQPKRPPAPCAFLENGQFGDEDLVAKAEAVEVDGQCQGVVN